MILTQPASQPTNPPTRHHPAAQPTVRGSVFLINKSYARRGCWRTRAAVQKYRVFTMCFFFQIARRQQLLWTQANNYSILVPPWAFQIFQALTIRTFLLIQNYHHSKHPKFHFMFSGRYWYHTTKIPFMFFGGYLSHIQDFQDLFERTFIIYRCPSFPQFPNLKNNNFEICKNNSLKNGFVFSCIFKVFLW